MRSTSVYATKGMTSDYSIVIETCNQSLWKVYVRNLIASKQIQQDLCLFTFSSETQETNNSSCSHITCVNEKQLEDAVIVARDWIDAMDKASLAAQRILGNTRTIYVPDC